MQENKSYEQLIYHPKTRDIADFERLVSLAAAAGFTHVDISGLSERSDYRGDDEDSPWCEWSIWWPSFFKHAQPSGLDAFPADFVKRQMDFMKKKHAIIEKHGLKGAYWANEPHWLSERVYGKHPRWRGARCDNSLRTAGLHFAPDVDNPEVREAYRAAAEEIVRACPLIDTFELFTNDSGSGYPWAGRLYVNVNGPTDTAGREMGSRVVDFLRVIRQGAKDGGAEFPRVFTVLQPRFTSSEAPQILHRLEEGIGVFGETPDPEMKAEHSLGHLGGWALNPYLSELGTPFGIIRGTARLKTSPVMRFRAGADTEDFFTAFRVAMEMPPARTTRQVVETATAIAAELYGKKAADTVVDAWFRIEESRMQADVGGVQTHGLTMLRWLTRPLVARQEELSDDERGYWEPYIYQSKSGQPEAYLDYLNLTGQPIAATWRESTPKCCAVDSIEQSLASAAGLFEKAAGEAGGGEATGKLRRESLRARALRCAFLTVRQVYQVGTLIYERRIKEKDTAVEPDLVDLPNGSMGSRELFFLHRALRWELDNVTELIELMESSSEPLIVFDRDPSAEGALKFGPNILEHLKLKRKIMLRHWRSAEHGWWRPTKGG